MPFDFTALYLGHNLQKCSYLYGSTSTKSKLKSKQRLPWTFVQDCCEIEAMHIHIIFLKTNSTIIHQSLVLQLAIFTDSTLGLPPLHNLKAKKLKCHLLHSLLFHVHAPCKSNQKSFISAVFQKSYQD